MVQKKNAPSICKRSVVIAMEARGCGLENERGRNISSSGLNV
jgi:hypothetical protein